MRWATRPTSETDQELSKIPDRDLSRWTQLVLTTHVRPYHRHHQTSGHVWQERFKASPIQEDEHLLRILRYVEPNPLKIKR